MTSLLPFRPLENYGLEIGHIGEGAYGNVIMTDLNYAIKQTPNIDGIVSDSSLHEIVSLLKVVSPYVIPLVDVHLDRETTSLILPLASQSLTQALGNPTLDLHKIGRQLGFGLADIHNANLLHLDLKPDNILLHNINQLTDLNLLFNETLDIDYTLADLWIADLGLSKIHTCALSPTRGVYFTLWYRPPEILLGGSITTKADVWAFGIILAEMFISEHHGSRLPFIQGYNEINQLLKILQITGLPNNSVLTQLPEWSSFQDIMSHHGITLPRTDDYKEDLRSYLEMLSLRQEDIDLLVYILNPDYTQRPNIFQVLEHPWFNLDSSQIPRQDLCYQVLQTYAHYPKNNWGQEGRASWSNRQVIIDWLNDVTETYNLFMETLALTIYLLDRMMSIEVIIKSRLQLYACAALYISSSFYDDEPILPEDIVIRIGRNSFTSEDLREVCDEILLTTSFDLAAVTSYFFLSTRFLEEPPLQQFALPLWLASLLTPSHFRNPRQVADDIYSLIITGGLPNETTQILYDEIQALPNLPIAILGKELLLLNKGQ